MAQLWKISNPIGRPPAFKTAEELWQAACKYFDWCDNNPIIETDFKGKDADRVEIPRMRAYTIRGLCVYLGCAERYLYDLEEALKAKKERGVYGEEEERFSQIIVHIRNIIYTQKFEGAAANQLNANIISRELGLAEKSDINVNDVTFSFGESKTDEQ